MYFLKGIFFMTALKIPQKQMNNKLSKYKNRKPYLEPIFVNIQCYNPPNQPNLNSVPIIFVLKFQKDLSTRTKVITWTPLCLQTEDMDRPMT